MIDVKKTPNAILVAAQDPNVIITKNYGQRETTPGDFGG